MAKYSYSAEEQSIVSPLIYSLFVNPLVKVLPYGLPANFITLVSFCCVIISFGVAVHGYVVNRYDWWWLIPILTLAYLVGDCADGKQARKTGTGSPLGEYFDHFCDSFVTGLLMGIVMISFKITHPVIITIGFFNLYFAQIASFWERYKRHVMYFGKIGSSEGVLAIGFSAWLMSIPPIHTVAKQPVIFGIAWGEVILIIIMVGAFVSAIQSLMRAKTISFRFVAHLILSLVFTYIVSAVCPDQMIYLTIVVMLYNASFLAPLLSAISLEKQEGFPEILVPLSCLLLVYKPIVPFVQVLQITYLAIRIMIQFIIFFRMHRQYWYWINPPQDNK